MNQTTEAKKTTRTGKGKATYFTRAIRNAIADYMRTEGCSCCRDIAGHEKNKERIAKLLHVPKYKDGSGYDFNRFSTDPIKF